MPYGVVDALDKELDRFQTLGVISSVNYSDWAAYMVMVGKQNGKVSGKRGEVIYEVKTEKNVRIHQRNQLIM